ncbi:cysteine--tRNA ligase [Candidatus Woesebacteria bacterium RIFCSPHIGHO2_01_FULL_38_9]|uniref:Cysteine--tRNA ligase n=2 Tax=Candidatus Woeseibacteriota TaxID=1752722 RepID=A0A1F7XZF9_9BACT|nr:MAG: cysteine--tRNA ligase [Candidatus Woesebacteria bacterium RIFCSPHIGHO2_01_FULL_38_9]OGM59361.1 MAG: cysteine--tRNA ligase [Candidatus Woesebacteria bacterium RIFCSPLOWO2_01_FULL_39_10]
MVDIFLTNSLTRKKEKFEPINRQSVGMYTCGPTVYYYPHIGNWRTFFFEDILRRVLIYNGCQVVQVMNATDVGHLTGDNVGDADLGEDRMEAAAKREGKTAWDIANFYIKDFLESREKLNIQTPEHFVRATDHIEDQINLIKRLEEKELTYVTKMGVYFDVSKFPSYGKLGGQKMIDKRAATREELKEDSEKKNPFDFALWKFSYPGGRSFDSAQDDAASRRHMEWDSPWGKGFPGWHIECSAMSMKYLGETLDIHTGGVDHIAIHHTNEIAQSEGATGKPFTKYWLHGEFLKVDGGRMGKSLGNAYTLHDIENKGYEALALRYLYLTAHYRDSLNFTWDSLSSAQIALNKLREQVLAAKTQITRTLLSTEKRKKVDDYSIRFVNAVNDDLNTPQALAVLWEALKSNIPSEDKYDLALSFDEVLGLKLAEVQDIKVEIPEEIRKLLIDRDKLRLEGKFEESDKLRRSIEEKGFTLEDTQAGTVVRPLRGSK